MHLTGTKLRNLYDIIDLLNQSDSSSALRLHLGHRLLELLDADFYASFVWNEQQQCFTERVSINMDNNNLKQYEAYYQFNDPITFKLQALGKASSVNEVISQPELVKTEFYNDFLSKDGLHYGVNMYALDNDLNIGDLRIWRHAGRSNFTRNDLEILQTLRPYITQGLKHIGQNEADTAASQTVQTINPELLKETYALTAREAEIATQVLMGKGDKAISYELDISFATVRTHMKNIFSKLSVQNRTALAHKLMTSPG